MPQLKAMSIRQPWAYSVCVGTKPVENKSRKTTYRGPLVIHASGQKADFNDIARAVGKQNVPSQLFAFGAAIGIVDLVDVVEMNRDLEDEPSANGPICWILKNPRLFKQPVPMTGQLGIFSVPTDVESRVQQAIQTAATAQAPQQFLAFKELMDRDAKADRCRGLVNLYLDSGMYKDVIRLCDKAIKEKSTDAWMFCARGLSRYRLCDDDMDDAEISDQLVSARKDLDRAVSSVADEEDESWYRFWRAVILHFLGEIEKQEEDIAICEKLNPENNWKELLESNVE